jgi:hypothetical protein
MTAAVFVIKEGNALPFPFNRRAIFMRHIQSPLSGLSSLTLRAASAAEYLSSARPAIPQAHHRVLCEFITFLGGTWPFADARRCLLKAHLTNASRGCS